MRIENIAIWVKVLEGMRLYYEKFFDAKSGEKYVNSEKKFSSYFLSFESGCRMEIMEMEGVEENTSKTGLDTGLIHFAIALGNEASVCDKTEELRKSGFQIAGEPRWTGDGYFESVALDPEGNRVEITI